MKQIKGLDTLRAFAIFFVIMQHNGIWFDDTVTNGRFIKEVLIPDGGFGVILFYVLSGFLITSILLNERKNTNDAGRAATIKNFYARRALRIFPIYYLFLFFLFVIDYGGIRDNILYHLTYTTNILCYHTNKWNSFSHAWTLSVEEQFYLLWPWFILFVNEKHLKYVFIVAIITGVVSTWYCMELKGHMAPLLVCNCFDSFGIGGLFAYATMNEKWSERFRHTMKWLSAFALCVYLYWKVGMFFHMDVHGLFFSKTVYSILSVWLIMSVVHARPSIFKKYFLESRFLTFIGKISYGIYLYHYIYNGLVYNQLNAYLNKATLSSPAMNAVIRDHHFYYWMHIAIVVLFSALSYYVIEKPFLNLKRFFKYKSGAAQPATI